jgi:hypothetical protein
MIGEDVLLEIDGTLDQLIRNAEVIETIDLKDLSETEIDAFQKTQESLLQHLIHMDEFLVQKRNGLKALDKRSASYKIQEKLIRFERLKNSYHDSLCRAQSKLPILLKRRSKKLFKNFN